MAGRRHRRVQYNTDKKDKGFAYSLLERDEKETTVSLSWMFKCGALLTDILVIENELALLQLSVE